MVRSGVCPGCWHVAVLVVMWLHASCSTASMVDSTTIDVYDVDTT